MNCQLRKYRTQIIGYEGAAGAPQAAHHHHVRGIGTDGDDSQHYHR
jgi:sirohydrochlorin cobaltochelatase